MTSHRGFTLLEMLVSLALMAILMAVVLPGFGQWLREARLTRQSQALVGIVQQGRTDALVRGARRTLCNSHDGVGCVDGNRRWRYALLLDASGRTAARITLPDEVSVRWKGLDTALHFRARPGRSMLNGTFYICPRTPQAGDSARRLIINRLGRIRRERIDAAEACA